MSHVANDDSYLNPIIFDPMTQIYCSLIRRRSLGRSDVYHIDVKWVLNISAILAEPVTTYKVPDPGNFRFMETQR